MTPQELIQGLVARGVPQHVAIAFAGNLMQESGLNPAINEIAPVVDGSRGGFGLAQWTGPRRKQLEAFAASQGKDVSDPNLQMDFLVWETQNTEKSAYDKIASTTNVADATRAVSEAFLRPGVPNLDARLANANALTGPAGMPAEALPVAGGAGVDTMAGDTKGDALTGYVPPAQTDPTAVYKATAWQPPAGSFRVVTPATPVADAPIWKPPAGSFRMAPQAPAASAADQYAARGFTEQVGAFNDGVILKNPATGEMAFTSPGYNTTDPAKISGMMQGTTPAATEQTQFDKSLLANQSPILTGATGIVQGFPFVGSYLDEAVGAMMGPDKQRAVLATEGAMAREYPKTNLALNLTGGVASAMAAGPAFKGLGAIGENMTLGGKALLSTLTGGALGAAQGAVYGAGDQSGDGRAANSMTGGLFGAGIGALLGPVATYAGAGIRAVLTKLRGTPENTIATTLKISPDAAKVVKQALDAGDMTQAEEALRRAGPDAMLADAGEPAKQLLDAAANTGFKAGAVVNQAVTERAAKSAAALTDTLDTYLGKPAAGIETAKGAVRSGTAAARTAAYDAAYGAPIDYANPQGQALENLLKRVPQSAIEYANKLMRANGDESAQILATVGPDGKVALKSLPDVRQWDYITRALKEVADAENGTGKMGGQTALGSAYAGLSRTIRDKVTELVPEYKTALDTATDAIGRVRSTDLGYSLLLPSTTREAVATGLSGASAAERNAAKEGLRTYIDDSMANVTATLANPDTAIREAAKTFTQLSSRAARAKMEALLGKPAAEAMMAAIDQERVAFELRAAIAKGSQTAIRGAIQGTTKKQAASGALETLADGSPAQASKRFVQIFTGNSQEAAALREMGLYTEIAQALTTVRGSAAQSALKLITKAQAGEPLTLAEATYLSGVVRMAVKGMGAGATNAISGAKK